MADTKALMQLAQIDVYQARLSGMILAALVQKGILTNDQVRAILDEVSSHVPADNPFRAVFEQVKTEFR